MNVILTRSGLAGALLAGALCAQAVTYQVGPSRTYKQLNDVRNLVNPGDVVEVDGNATYSGASWTRSGTQAQPITIRGMAQGTQRPVIDAGGAADAFRMDSASGINHYVVEDLVISNAINRCVYLRGHNITLRRVTVHTCRDHGILGSDTLTGDITLTEVEVYGSGNAAVFNDSHHPIYISTDQGAYPNAVLTIEKSWIHDNFSGNGIKSRAKTVRVRYNWIESTDDQAHTVELIGPDGPSGAPVLCPVPNGTNDAQLCTGEVVGNVLIARGNRAFMMRLGSDGTGWSRGRYHVVNNTFIANGNFNSSSSAMIRAFGELQSIELHNNIFWIQQGDSVGIRIVRDAEAVWEGGSRRVIGSNNLVTGSASTYAAGIPASQIAGLTGTVFTPTANVFVNVSAAALTAGTGIDARLPASSPARLAGNAGSTSTAGYQIPNPTNLPALQPPLMRPSPGVFAATARPQATDLGGNPVNGAIAIGAFEYPTVAAPPPSGPLTANPATLDFGGQSMNTTSPPLTVTFTNTSGASITVTSMTPSAGYAVASNTCTAAVPAAGTCAVGVTFTPPIGAATGPANGTLTAAYAGGPTGATLAGTAEKSLVTHYYRSILRRAPDGAGKAFWEGEATRVSNLGANVNEVWYSLAQTFFFSPEYFAFNRDNNGFITDLYVTFFNRQPDPGGLNFWTNNLAGGMPREVALAEFMLSTEFRNFSQAIFGNPTVRAELNTVMDFYRGLLSRLPDNGGFNFWVGRFRAAQCQSQAAVVAEVESISSAFALSAEYAARSRTNAQYVGDLYNAFLRRGGDLTGVLFWINQIATGARTRENVRIEFKNSPEFQVRANAVASQGCLP